MKKNDQHSKISGTLKNTIKKIKELELIINRSPAILCIWRFDRDWLPGIYPKTIPHRRPLPKKITLLVSKMI
jgi:hypothetical protein